MADAGVIGCGAGGAAGAGAATGCVGAGVAGGCSTGLATGFGASLTTGLGFGMGLGGGGFTASSSSTGGGGSTTGCGIGSGGGGTTTGGAGCENSMVIGGISGGTTGSCGVGVWLTQTITAPCSTNAKIPSRTTSRRLNRPLGVLCSRDSAKGSRKTRPRLSNSPGPGLWNTRGSVAGLWTLPIYVLL
ncbi:hypothetical protein D3C76_1235260 [compost metagenome]